MKVKTPEEIQPNYAPIYAAALYPKLCKLFQKHGYALSIHGSMARDFDIIAVPWSEKLSSPEDVIKEVTDGFAIRQIGEPDTKRYGRVAYTISVGFGECALDLSFFPGIAPHEDESENE
jgi:hypothetical protein